MSCQKCGGTGWYRYDHNHAMICPDCCPHDQGVVLLLEYYGDHNGLWCCQRGCGQTWAGVSDYGRAVIKRRAA